MDQRGTEVDEFFANAQELARRKYTDTAALHYEIGILRGVIRTLSHTKEGKAEVASQNNYMKQDLLVYKKLSA